MDGCPELIVLGSTAIDSIETPLGKHPELLGGSAVFAGYSARFFTDVGLLSVVGDDFPKDCWKFLTQKGFDIRGVEVGGNTFRWSGLYEGDMSSAKTLATELNCLEGYMPKLPEEYRKAKFAFLANTHPAQQLEVIRQLEAPQIIAMDTMNLWIETARDQLMEAIKKVHILILNDAEAKQLFNSPNLVTAAKNALNLGLKCVIIKKGEHGAVMFAPGTSGAPGAHFSAPGYPLETIKDPTGCGDALGGGFMGYVAGCGDVSEQSLRKAVVYGSVCASFNAEDFGINRLREVKKKDIEQRYKEFKAIVHF